jgi:hypothetical protein
MTVRNDAAADLCDLPNYRDDLINERTAHGPQYR